MTKTEELAAFIDERFAGDGRVESGVKGAYFYRSNVCTEFRAGIYTPSVCAALRGAKALKIGEEALRYDEAHYALSASHIPVLASVERCPFLSVRVGFELPEILEAAREIDARFGGKKSASVYIGEVEGDFVAALSKLVFATRQEGAARAAMAKLAKKELLYALLLGDARDYLLQFALADTMEHRISRAICEIRDNFAEQINMRELAAKVGISASSLYHNFRKITKLSPLEFQKRIRLEEAKFMMINDGLSASDAAFEVGYASGSQFSREFAKTFGAPPKTYALAMRTANAR